MSETEIEIKNRKDSYTERDPLREEGMDERGCVRKQKNNNGEMNEVSRGRERGKERGKRIDRGKGYEHLSTGECENEGRRKEKRRTREKRRAAK